MQDKVAIINLLQNARDTNNTDIKRAIGLAYDASIRARLGKCRTLELQSVLLASQLLNSSSKNKESITQIEDCILRYNMFQLTDEETHLFYDLLSELAFGYFSISQYQEAISTLQKALDVVNLYKLDEIRRINCFKRLGIAFTYIDKYEKSRTFLFEALALSSKNGLEEQLHSINVNLGENYYRSGETETAIGYYSEAESYFNRTSHPAHCVALMSLGALYFASGDHIKAENLLLRAEEESIRRNNTTCLLRVYKNLSELYSKLQRIDEALAKANKGLSMAVQTDNKYDQILMLRVLGRASFILHDFEQAHEYFTEALQLSERLQTRNQSSILYNDLAMVYLNQNKPHKAKIHAKIAIDEAKAISAVKLVQEAKETLELLETM